MNKSIFIAGGFAFVLTACATGDGPAGYRHFGVGAKSVVTVSVDVIEDHGDAYIIVSQEPIYVAQDTSNAIYWRLPPTGPYYFSNTGQNPGIKFDTPPPRTSCDYYNGDSRIYVCTYNKATKKKYPYTIRVTKDGTTIVKSDPTVMNN